MTAKEFRRQQRLINQSLSAHTSLAERYRRRKLRITASILVLSVLATALAFAGGDHQADLAIATASLPTWAGVLATIVFALALIDLISDWEKKAGIHEEAGRRLGALKSVFSAVVTVEGEPQTEIDLSAEYWTVMNSIAPIPNRNFVALKAEHLRKVEQSTTLDGAPTVFVPVLRLFLRLQGTRQLLSNFRPEQKEESFLPDESGQDPPANPGDGHNDI